MRRLCVLLALLWGIPAAAGTLTLDGNAIEGGLMLGRTDPGTVVTFDGRKLRLTPDGRFVIGFSRDAKPKATLTLRHADGTVRTETIPVKQRKYKIQRIDGLPPKMVTPPKEVWERIKRDRAAIKRARSRDGAEPHFLAGWIWPTKGRISGVYGSQRILNGTPRQPHYGIDIAAPAGTPVVAPSDGVITLVAGDMYYTGGTIILDHGHGLSSAFLHMRDISVTEGQKVSKGEAIGTVGSTGRSTGPHLDWRINLFEARIDPSLLVPPMQKPKKKPAKR
ncbi:MAG: M23 family metallopeptidase [Alphaproteobacteria bacterium]|nr:M23 family metallopeptidase [Alphaproteobacteria bacterium]